MHHMLVFKPLSRARMYLVYCPDSLRTHTLHTMTWLCHSPDLANLNVFLAERDARAFSNESHLLWGSLWKPESISYYVVLNMSKEE